MPAKSAAKARSKSTLGTLPEWNLSDLYPAIDSPELKNGSGSSFGVHAYPNDTSGGVSVCVSVPNNAPGQEVTVKVTADYNWLPVPKVLGGSATFTTVPLAGSASMRIEASLPSSWITTTLACA